MSGVEFDSTRALDILGTMRSTRSTPPPVVVDSASIRRCLAKPADLPVDLGSVSGFVLNLATAKALSLDLPPDILIQATDVIR